MSSYAEARDSAINLLQEFVPLRDRLNASPEQLVIWLRRYAPEYAAEHQRAMLVSPYDIAMHYEHQR